MGEIFAQRRAAAKKGGGNKNQTAPQLPGLFTPVEVGRPPSLADIQEEQKQEQKYSCRKNSNERRDSDRHAYSQNDDRSLRQDDSRSSYHSGNHDSTFRGDRRDNRGGGNRRPDRSKLPLERGCISSLKDSFGFIYCADREEEIFFHYSEVDGTRPTDLKVDDELEFRVGESKSSDKMAAFDVVVLEPGTIVWEVEEEPGTRFQGIVEKPLRPDRGSTNFTEGTIRVLVAAEHTMEEDVAESIATESEALVSGPIVYFAENDYLPEPSADSDRSLRRLESMNSQSSRGPSNRLATNDLVEFTMAISSRNKCTYARNIKLLLSDRDRQRLAREKELLANAKVEQGVVCLLKTDFGFLKSNRRREEIHFHYSQVLLPEDDDEGDFVLKEGQDLEFLVITEPVGKGGRERSSARQIKFLPKGSVIFHEVLATGVTGTVTRPPHASDLKYTSELVGKVQLSEPLADINDEGNENIISEIDFHPADSPGGTFCFREGNAVGLWVHEGDVLLFDVVKDIIDGSCRLKPTKRVNPCSEEENEHDAPSVKMISTSLAGRAEGVIHAIKDGFGFIAFAERPIDVYFRLFELMPDAIQSDLRKNMGLPNTDNGAPLKFQVGTEVQFDLSLQGMGPRNRNRKGQRIQQEKENLKAQRIVLLPSGTIRESMVIAQSVKGVVVKEDPKQPFAGLIDLEKEWTTMSPDDRHPLVSKLIKSLLSIGDSHSRKSVVYPDILATRDDEVVTSLAEFYGKGKLTITHIPVPGENDFAGRICIMRLDQNELHSDEVNAFKFDRCSDENVLETEEKDGNDTDISSEKKKEKKRLIWEKPIKRIRYDKHCLIEGLRRTMPPNVGDLVQCDIVQSRRTGDVSLVNVDILERSKVRSELSSASNSYFGIVTEVVAARQFGFISLCDETATKRDVLFFQTKSILSTPALTLSPDEAAAGLSLSPIRAPSIRKGDEVEFEIVVGENGKKSAINIRIAPKGTLNIPSKASKDACHGIVLLEPSHTTLKNTPSRKASRPATLSKSPIRGAGTNRWENVELDGKRENNTITDVKEEGFILLTKDPCNMFAQQKKGSSNTSAIATISDVSDMDAINDTKNAESSTDAREVLEHENEYISCSCLPYKNGAIAIQGNGATNGADGTSGPRRGDLVSFVKAKSGKGVRDVRVVTKGAAVMQRGRLESITITLGDDVSHVGTAKFIATPDQQEYLVDLKEVISCDVSLLKENESVEGILHEGHIFGICRTSDLYLESKLGLSHKERPKLNLTVRKGLGGTIMAQSGMAKGPNGTCGFFKGWTARLSKYTNEISPFPNEPPPATEEAS